MIKYWLTSLQFAKSPSDMARALDPLFDLKFPNDSEVEEPEDAVDEINAFFVRVI